MPDSYQLDLESFSLERLQRIFESGEVLPSRQILTEQVAERLAVLAAQGITNVQGLVDALSTKKKVESLAQRSGLPEDYLTILGRQARSYIPTPVMLKDIPGVKPEDAERLAAVGIKHSKHLFERAQTPAERTALAEQTGVQAETLLELVRLADLARAGWVGPILVRLFYAAGIDSIGALAQADAETLFARVRAVNAEQQLTRGAFTQKDVAACIETAQELPRVIV